MLMQPAHAQVNTAGAACSGRSARHPSVADPVAGTQQQHIEKPVLWHSVMSCVEAKYGVVGTVQAARNKEQHILTERFMIGDEWLCVG